MPIDLYGVPEKASEAGAADTGVVGTSAGQIVAVEGEVLGIRAVAVRNLDSSKAAEKTEQKQYFPKIDLCSSSR